MHIRPRSGVHPALAFLSLMYAYVCLSRSYARTRCASHRDVFVCWRLVVYLACCQRLHIRASRVPDCFVFANFSNLNVYFLRLFDYWIHLRLAEHVLSYLPLKFLKALMDSPLDRALIHHPCNIVVCLNIQLTHLSTFCTLLSNMRMCLWCYLACVYNNYLLNIFLVFEIPLNAN